MVLKANGIEAKIIAKTKELGVSLAGIASVKDLKAEWEKLSIFLNFLVPKLPSPIEEDLSKGILDAIDMDSYRVEKRAMQKILSGINVQVLALSLKAAKKEVEDLEKNLDWIKENLTFLNGAIDSIISLF